MIKGYKLIDLIALLIVLFFFSNSSYAIDEFVRGFFSYDNQHCYWYWYNNGNWSPCCDEISWGNELDLLEEINANHLNSFIAHNDSAFIDTLSDFFNGDVRVAYLYGGYDDYYNLDWWAEKAYLYNDPDSGQWWQDGVDSVIQEIYSDQGDKAGFCGYAMAEEWARYAPTEDYYPGLYYMVDKAKQIDNSPDHFTTMVTYRGQLTSSFPDVVDNLDIIELDYFPFSYNLPPSGSAFQNTIKNLLAAYDFMAATFKDEQTAWSAYIQTCAQLTQQVFDGRCDPDDSVLYRGPNSQIILSHRMPSREEMRLQAFLAVSRGAKGIIGFTYGSNFGGFLFLGLTHWFNDGTPGRQKYYPSRDTMMTNWDPNYAYNYTFNESSFDNVKDLYHDLKDFEETLLKLYWVDANSYDSVGAPTWPDSTSFIKSLTDDSLYFWEAAVFYDSTSLDSTDYFMLVNRITSTGGADSTWSEAPSRDVTVILARPSCNTVLIEEVMPENITICTADSLSGGLYYFSFTDTIPPGDGTLYSITDALSGTISENLSISHDTYVMGDVILDADDTLTIEKGVTLYFKPEYGVDISIYGTLIADGTVSEPCEITSWNEYSGSPEAGDWNRIDFKAGSSGSFEYCDIKYANYGVYLRDTSNVAINNCSFSDCYNAGLRNEKGNLSASSCTIEDNTYGVISSWAQTRLDSCYILNSQTYGIYAQYQPAYSLDSSFIINCTIRTGQDSIFANSQYGVRAYGNDKIRIENNKIRTFAQGGIYLYDTDGIVLNNEVDYCTFYGIYSTYSSNGLIS